MNIDLLFSEEKIAGGWTHEAKITYADLAALSAGNTATFALASLPAAAPTGFPASDVFGWVQLYLKTPFVFSDGSLISCAVTVGDATNGVTFDLASTELASAGTFITAKTSNTWNSVIAALTKNIYFTGTAAKNLNTATAGEVHIFWARVPLYPFARD
jgi:hypothetical protein